MSHVSVILPRCLIQLPPPWMLTSCLNVLQLSRLSLHISFAETFTTSRAQRLARRTMSSACDLPWAPDVEQSHQTGTANGLNDQPLLSHSAGLSMIASLECRPVLRNIGRILVDNDLASYIICRLVVLSRLEVRSGPCTAVRRPAV